jgi:Fe-S cluster assembly iron-binding protein IscA
MIRISKSAIEKLRESNESTQKNLFRIFISGIG